MFYVFAIDVDRQRHIFDRKRPERFDEKTGEYVDLTFEEFLGACTPKVIKEFELLDVARQFVAMLPRDKFAHAEIKIRVLQRPKRDGGKVTRAYVPVSMMDQIDINEQVRLRGMLDGSRFAPGAHGQY